MQYIYNIFFKNIHLPKYNFSNSLNTNTFQNFNFFSIDPINCKDIDDTLSIKENDNYIIINVSIANPIEFLNLDIIKSRAINSFSTLYNEPYDKNKNLWGDKITELASLDIGVNKPAYSIIFYINKISLEIDKIEDYPSTIINKIKTNYEDCLKYKDIEKLYELTKFLSKSDIDTHELVSFWMIKTNNYIGNKYKYLDIPCRVMKYNNSQIYDIKDNDIKEIFINKMSSSAFYSLDENYHYKLNTFDYTHFTSPIRRIIDTLIQYCIINNYNFKELLINLNIDIDNINKNDKNTRKYHNNINLLKLINKINWINEEAILEGWIYEINFNKFNVSVFFKEIGFQKVFLKNKFINEKIILKCNEFMNSLIIGNKYKFIIKQKLGFLPYEKYTLYFYESELYSSND